MRKSFTRFLSLLFVFCLFSISTIVNAQETQKTVELYAEDVSACYNVSNDYAVKISMRDFISLVQFNLVLDYSEGVLNYTGPGTFVIGGTNGTITKDEVAGTLTFAWDNGSTPVTFANNVKTDVVTLHFALDNFPNNLAASYVSPLTWTTTDFYYNTGVSGTEILNTDVSTNGKLTATVGITEPQVSVGSVSCDGGDAVGTVTAPAQGTGFTYLFNEDANPLNWTWTTNASYSAPENTTNTVRVKDANGCISLAKTFAIADLAPVTYTASKQDVTCAGGNGELQMNAVGGTGPYTYWVIPDAAFAAVQPGLISPAAKTAASADYKKINFQILRPAGIYHVAVDDANMCRDLSDAGYWTTLTILDTNSPVVVTLGTITGETCADANDGSIAVTVAGGVAAGEYKVSIDGGLTWVTTTSQGYTFEDVMPGTYTITAMDDNGCEGMSADAVVAPKAPITFDMTIVDTSCGGDNDGQIIVSNIAGGTAQYTIDITENGVTTSYTTTSVETSHTFTGLMPTYYSLSITDANDCSVNYNNPNGTGNVIAVQSPEDIKFDLIVTNPLCYDGTATLTADNVTGGTDVGYMYSINGTDWQVSNTFTVPQPFDADYTVWIKNASGNTCEVSQTTDEGEVVAPAHLTASVSQVFAPSCKEGSDGNIYVTIVGGTSPYYYSINSGTWVEANSSIAIIKATVGTHIINIKDSNGCEIDDVLSVPVTQNDNVITATVSGSIECFGGSVDSDGNKITIDVAIDEWADDGVDRAYSYYYSASESTVYTTGTGFIPEALPTPTTFLAGTYWIGAMDQFGCKAAPVEVIVNQGRELNIADVVANGASCYGTFGGNVTVYATGGTVSGLLQYAVVNSQSALDNIPESKWLDFQIAESLDPATPSIVSFQVEKGTYYLAVRDDKCAVKTYGPITVEGYDQLLVDETKIVPADANCFGESNGSINVPMTAVSGGAGAYMFTLLNSVGNPITNRIQQATGLFEGLAAGTYSVLVEDSEGCPSYTTDPITLTQPVVLSFTADKTYFSCNASNDGVILITVAGGTAPYKFAVNNQNVWFAVNDTPNTKVYIATEPGIHNVWVKDAHGCVTGPTEVEILQPEVITPEVTVVNNVLCNGGSTGKITVSATGGWDEESVYEYKVDADGVWGNAASIAALGLSAGSHTLYVRDIAVYAAPFQQLDCVYSVAFDISEPDAMVYNVAITDVKCKGGSDGTFTVSIASGGTPWTGNVNDALNGFDVQLTGNAYNVTTRTGSDHVVTFTGLAPSFYTVHITDSRGCTLKATVGDDEAPYETVESWEVTEPEFALTIAPEWKKDATCYGSQDGQFVINADGGSGEYKYWAGLSVQPDGHILVPQPPAEDSELWQTSSEFNVGAGTWVVWAMDSNGCMVGGETSGGVPVNTWRVKIAQPTEITWAFHMMGSEPDTIHYKMPSCNGMEDGQIHLVNVMGGTAPYTVVATGKSSQGVSKVYTQVLTAPVSPSILWILNNVAASDADGYLVKVMDANGCETAVKKVVIKEPNVLSVTLEKGDDSFTCPDAVEGFIEASAMGGTKPYTYTLYKDGVIHTADVTPSAFLVQIGHTFMVEVKDAKGCTATAEITINPVVPAEFKISETTCYDDAKASAIITAWGESDRTFEVRYRLNTESYPTTGNFGWVALNSGDSLAISELTFANVTETENFYYFQVRDSKGCMTEEVKKSFVPTQHPLQVAVEQSEDQLSASLTITGGISPYSYKVGDGEMMDLPVDGDTFQVVDLQAGDNVVTVYDAHGCNVPNIVVVDPVSVTAVPANGNNMEQTFDVVLTFNRDVTVPEGAITVTGGTATVAGTSPGKEFTVSITAEDLADVSIALANTIVDAADNALEATTFNYTVGDHVAPTVTVTAPEAPVATVFTVGLEFNEPVSGVLDKTGITVTGGTLTDVTGEAGGMVYTLTVSSTEQTEVSIVLSDLIKDISLNANAFAGQTLTYTTGDFTAPTLVTWTPTDGETIADNHPMLKMTLSEDVMVGEGGSLKIYKVNTTEVALDIPITAAMINGKDVTVTYSTQSGLDKDTRYYVLVDGTALKDNAGNLFAGVSDAAVWTFKTGPEFATGIDPLDDSLEFKVYPNPFVDNVTVTNSSKLSKIVVSNIAGQTVKEIVNPESVIKLNELRSGVYFITMYNKDNVIAKTAKVVKR
ncbi:MAG: T9SS type A sorting domain-containing protein [Prolixibacteraceae bacterium]|jgi:hypothetical protein